MDAVVCVCYGWERVDFWGALYALRLKIWAIVMAPADGKGKRWRAGAHGGWAPAAKVRTR